MRFLLPIVRKVHSIKYCSMRLFVNVSTANFNKRGKQSQLLNSLQRGFLLIELSFSLLLFSCLLLTLMRYHMLIHYWLIRSGKIYEACNAIRSHTVDSSRYSITQTPYALECVVYDKTSNFQKHLTMPVRHVSLKLAHENKSLVSIFEAVV